MAEPTSGLAAIGRERSDHDESDAVSDRVHPPQSQVGGGIHAGHRSSVGTEMQAQDHADNTGQGTGKKKVNLYSRQRKIFKAALEFIGKQTFKSVALKFSACQMHYSLKQKMHPFPLLPLKTKIF